MTFLMPFSKTTLNPLNLTISATNSSIYQSKPTYISNNVSF